MFLPQHRFILELSKKILAPKNHGEKFLRNENEDYEDGQEYESSS